MATSGQFKIIVVLAWTSCLPVFAQSSLELYQKGYKTFKAGRYNASATIWTDLIKKEPFYWEAYWGRGFSRLKMGQFGKALNDFSHYQAGRDLYGKEGEDPSIWDFNYNENYSAAVGAFSHAIQAKPKWYLFAGRAVAHYGLKDFAAAKADLDVVMRGKLPENSELKAALFAMRGNCKTVLGDLNGAVADYTAGIKERGVAPIYHARGLAYSKLGKQDLAANDERKSATMDFARAAQSSFMLPGKK